MTGVAAPIVCAVSPDIFCIMFEHFQVEDRVTVARVCREWSRLSCLLPVVVGYGWTANVASVLELRKLLQGVANVQLDFEHIGFDNSSGVKHKHFIAQVEKLLLGRMELVRGLTLHVSKPVPESLLRILHLPAPKMQRLCICGYDGARTVARQEWVADRLPILSTASFSTSFPHSSTFPHVTTVRLSSHATHARALSNIQHRFPLVRDLLVSVDAGDVVPPFTLPATVRRLRISGIPVDALSGIVGIYQIPEIFVSPVPFSFKTVSKYVAALSSSLTHADVYYANCIGNDLLRIALRTRDAHGRSRTFGPILGLPTCSFSARGLPSLFIHGGECLSHVPFTSTTALAHLELSVPLAQGGRADLFALVMPCPGLLTLKLTVDWDPAVALPYWLDSSSVEALVRVSLLPRKPLHLAIQGADLVGDRSGLDEVVSGVSVDRSVRAAPDDIAFLLREQAWSEPCE